MAADSIRFRHFLGRASELDALKDARKSLAKSSGSFVLISGEAGIGKTRLLSEFIERADSRRTRNLVNTECLQRAQQPLGPLRALLRTMIPSLMLSELPPNIVRTLVQLSPEQLPQAVVAAFGNIVLEKEQLFAEVLELLRIVCMKRATILTVEDIHWADGSTLDFLHYLAHRMGSMRLLIIATYRSDELIANEDFLIGLSPLLRESVVRSIVLEPLNPFHIRQLVDGALEGRTTLSQAAVADIERLSEGNPFFAEELVNDFVERATVKASPAQLPLSIRASITARLNGFTEDERNILKHAAVLGQRFDPGVLALVMSTSVDRLSPALRRAHERNLLVADGPTRMSCRFRHALTRQSIYDAIPRFETRELHARILGALEEQPERLEELAYHAWESGNAAKSLAYNERAATAMFAMRALPESLTCFERALESASGGADRARIFEQIGALERLQGHYARAADAFESAMALRLELGDFDAAAMAAAMVLGQRYNLGDEQALANARRFLAEFGDKAGDQARNNLLVTAARVASAIYDIRSAEHLIELVRDPSNLPVGTRHNFLIVELMRHGYFGNVREWQRTAEAVSDLLPSLTADGVVAIESALALTGIYLAQNPIVEAAIDRADRVVREIGTRGPRLYNVAVRAAYVFQRGRIGEASACIAEVATHSDVSPATWLAAPVAAHIAAATGDDSLIRALGIDNVRRARQRLDDPDCWLLVAAYAAYLFAIGAKDEARSDISHALDAITSPSNESMFVLINASLILPEREQSRIESIVARGLENTSDVASACRALVAGIRASRFGKAEDAERLGRLAAHTYERLGWPLLEARAREVSGDVAGACNLYDICGATAALHRLGAVSASTATNELIVRLSSRENQIVALVAAGLTNTEIARNLNIAKKTVEKHLSSVFEKLGFRSRAQVAAFVATASSSPSARLDRAAATTTAK